MLEINWDGFWLFLVNTTIGGVFIAKFKFKPLLFCYFCFLFYKEIHICIRLLNANYSKCDSIPFTRRSNDHTLICPVYCLYWHKHFKLRINTVFDLGGKGKKIKVLKVQSMVIFESSATSNNDLLYVNMFNLSENHLN